MIYHQTEFHLVPSHPNSHLIISMNINGNILDAYINPTVMYRSLKGNSINHTSVSPTYTSIHICMHKYLSYIYIFKFKDEKKFHNPWCNESIYHTHIYIFKNEGKCHNPCSNEHNSNPVQSWYVSVQKIPSLWTSITCLVKIYIYIIFICLVQLFEVGQVFWTSLFLSNTWNRFLLDSVFSVGKG